MNMTIPMIYSGIPMTHVSLISVLSQHGDDHIDNVYDDEDDDDNDEDDMILALYNNNSDNDDDGDDDDEDSMSIITALVMKWKQSQRL